MTLVICNRHGRTRSCHRCPEGKPHEEEARAIPDGYVAERTLCTESVPFQEVTKIKVRTNG
jgi:hypothetical protein